MLKWFLILLFFLVPGPQAKADIVNFDLSGRIYTKWLYRNNDSQGLLTYGNPNTAYYDNLSGDNGVGSEFELNIIGKVSKFVEAGVRLQSRFGTRWHDYWENGNIRYTKENTSGESLGMDHAEYIKLRGYYVRFTPQWAPIRWIHAGSTDLDMFNLWTIGKIRYIDRDNTKGLFVQGGTKNRVFSYHLGIIALPRLWVGPNWSTGVGEGPDYGNTFVVNPFYTQDYAYALKLNIDPHPVINFEIIASFTNDIEANIFDPDAQGTLNPDGPKDHTVDMDRRYNNGNVTLETRIKPHRMVNLNILGGYSFSNLNSNYAANGVELNNGFYPIIYGNTQGYSVKARLDVDFDFDFSMKFEYFNISTDWTSIFGTRREDDALLTDGIAGYGQLPTLNIANEFIDFDEPFYESCIGWHGGTFLFQYNPRRLKLALEYSLIGYNTNMQNRNVDTRYPDFLYTDGYTDTDLYSFENPPSIDRGRDLRSVYHRYQDRMTHIAMLKASYLFNVGRGLELEGKVKFVFDKDNRVLERDDDNYYGYITQVQIKTSYQFTDELKVSLGYQFNKWIEEKRCNATGDWISGSYYDYDTLKHKVFAEISYNFAGIKFKYYGEYLRKDLDRGGNGENLLWNVFRSKATMEVSW